MNPIFRAALELANRIQGENLAFEPHPEGGVRPAFPQQDAFRHKQQFGVQAIGLPDPKPEETYFVDETGEYGPTRPEV